VDEEKRVQEVDTETSKTFERNPSPNSMKKLKVLLQRIDVNQLKKKQGAPSGGAEGASGTKSDRKEEGAQSGGAEGASGAETDRKEDGAPSRGAEEASGTDTEETQSISRNQSDNEVVAVTKAAEEARLKGGFHDQADAEWMCNQGPAKASPALTMR
jgi:hypothetical protein